MNKYQHSATLPVQSSLMEEFEPAVIETNQYDGSMLMIIAYLGLWIVLFVFIFIGYRKQCKIDVAIRQLERRVQKVQGDNGGKD